MKTVVLLCAVLAAIQLTTSAALADFRNGQPADLALGDSGPDTPPMRPTAAAVDPVTHKVFVSYEIYNCVLRFSNAAALQNPAVAEAVLGQPEFGYADRFAIGPHTASAFTMSYPSGLAVDAGGRLWVADMANHRVLRFDNAATLPSGSPASGVLGQPNFASNTDGAAENQMSSPFGVTADPAGHLWVADTSNDRVLRFDQASGKPNGGNADGVLGQAGFGVSFGSVSAAGMIKPRCVAVESVQSLLTGTWTTSRLWVGDSDSNRVLRFDSPAAKPNGANANGVLGQPDFTSKAGVLTRNGMQSCYGLATGNGNLWALDHIAHRVLFFANAATRPNGADADKVLGQSTFTTGDSGYLPGKFYYPTGLALDGARLWVVSSISDRVVRFENAAAKASGNDADGLLSGDPFSAPPPDGRHFADQPSGIVIDPNTRKVFVCDPKYNRVLRFGSTQSLSTNAAAEAVFGQPSLLTQNQATSATGMWQPTSVAMDHLGHLWVADSYNQRVLRFDNAATAPSGSAAAQVLGQSGFVQNQPGITSSRLNTPQGLAVESSYNGFTFTWTTLRLWVADSSNNRVLRFDDVMNLGNGAPASGVLGQPDFASKTADAGAAGMSYPIGVCVAAPARLWVADASNGRVLRFEAAAQKPNGAAASGVLLQSGFGVVASGPATQSRGVRPSGVCVSESGRLFVGDVSARRVVWFDAVAALANGAPANGVLGQPDFDSLLTGYSWKRTGECHSCALDPATGRLWVTDQSNWRVLRFTPALESTIVKFGFNNLDTFTLNIHGRSGEKFEIRSSSDLSDWSHTEATITPSGAAWQDLIWTAPLLPQGPKRFYRLQKP